MGMPITIEIADPFTSVKAIEKAYDYFKYIDEKFSPFKATSEVSMLNRGEVTADNCSDEMKTILKLSQETKDLTDGYFDIVTPDGKYNPSGLVKGWAIQNAGEILKSEGLKNFYVDAGGDIQAYGHNHEDRPWRAGIRNPFDLKQIVRTLRLEDRGVATSGTYIRGKHIYNPLEPKNPVSEIVSLTVIGPNIYEADRFATAAFAMGEKGIAFIECMPGLEGYMIDRNGIATMTRGFEYFTE